jgi:hypothetical protein
MNDQADDLESEEEIFASTVSDEALEAAAGLARGPTTQAGPWLTNAPACC